MTESGVKKIVQQIEKQVDVIKAFYHTDEETIFQESALYKVKSSYLFEERQIDNEFHYKQIYYFTYIFRYAGFYLRERGCYLYF